MSLLAGNYYIVNTVSDLFSGAKLAISYNGIGNALTVNPLNTTDDTQVWSISNYDSTQQSISPINDDTVQVAFGDGFITALSAGSYTWIITEGEGDNNNYTIQDGQQSISWLLDAPIQGDNVTYSATPDNDTQYWWFYNY